MRAEEIYQRLQTGSAILELVGECEDAHFDCKEWPTRDEDAQKMLAKAACGLTNAEGGVLIIGMKAKSNGKDDPDIVSAAVPVPDTALVKSKVLNLIGDLVEPRIVGVQAEEIAEAAGAKSGFVLVLIPASEGSPRRSRKEWKFFRRIGAGTFPMEYFEIEEMFGKRPHPKLGLVLEKVRIGTTGFNANPQRIFRLGLSNTGRGLARFPSIRFKSSCGLSPDRVCGLDGNGSVGLPIRASDGGWVIFRGGIDDVIYPVDTLSITQLLQSGKFLGRVGQRMDQGRWVADDPNRNVWQFDPISFSCEISCEGLPTIAEEISFDAEET